MEGETWAQVWEEGLELFKEVRVGTRMELADCSWLSTEDLSTEDQPDASVMES